MTALNLFQYAGQQVRTVIVDGEPWFVLSDLCAVLDITNVGNVASRIDPLSIRQTDVENSRGQKRLTLVANESGMYEVIIRSDKPEAASFRRWITSEVLPAIRKTGSYARPAELSRSDLARMVLAAEAEREALEAKVAEDAPKVLFADSVAASDSTILVGDLAKIMKGNGLDIGAKRLFDRLRDEGFLIKRKGSDWNMPTQYSMDLGLFRIKESTHQQPDGTVRITKTPKVTGKGQAYFVNRYITKALAVPA